MDSPFVFEKVAQLSSVGFSSATLTCMLFRLRWHSAGCLFVHSPKWMFHSQKWLFHAHKWLFHALSTLCPRSSFSETAARRRTLRQHAHVRVSVKVASQTHHDADQAHITRKASGCWARTTAISENTVRRILNRRL